MLSKSRVLVISSVEEEVLAWLLREPLAVVVVDDEAAPLVPLCSGSEMLSKPRASEVAATASTEIEEDVLGPSSSPEFCAVSSVFSVFKTVVL